MGKKVAWVAWPLLLLSLPQPLGYASYQLKHFLWILYAVIVTVGLGVGFLTFIVYIVVEIATKTGIAAALTTWKINYKEEQLQIRLSRPIKAAKIKKGPSFRSLLEQRIHAAHDNICPPVVFKNPEDMQ